MFSGGKGSWGAARYLRDEAGVDPARITLLFTDTNGEDPDLYRFLHEAAADLGSELVVLDNDGATIWDVFRKQRMIGNTRLSVCSRKLKQEPARKWLKANTDPEQTQVVVGIDYTEAHRLPAIERNYAPWGVVAPLAERGGYSKARVAQLLAEAGIEEPALYGQGFAHNNCAGACVRAGQGQWKHLLDVNPARYAEEEEQERSFRQWIGKDVSILRDRRGGVLTPLTLESLRLRVEAATEESPALIDLDDIGGCGCMTDLATPEEALALLGEAESA